MSANEPALPQGILTIGPPFRHDAMPDEVAMLLPTNPGPVALVDDLLNESAAADNLILGLLLASPFLNVKVESTRLHRAGFTRIANLPSVVQHDEEFSQQLADVDLGFERELQCLSQFRARGFEAAAVVADARTAAAAAAIDPEIMVVLPRVADFAAGFPSLRQRGSAVQSASEAARDTGWTGILLGLGESREAENASLWPAGLDGLVCRPEVVGG